TNATFFAWAAFSCLATAARVVALRMMPSAPVRSGVSKPFWICWGEPSVAIVFDDQPSLAAASATILPCVWHAAAPQLMNTSFLPAGTVLAIGVVTVRLLERFGAGATHS